VRWAMAMGAYIYPYQQPRFSRELVHAKSSTSRWIASRSLKLSDRSCAESYCASAPVGCGCVRRRHSVQSVLPGARATDLVQPSCWHRLPPPCAMQWSVQLRHIEELVALATAREPPEALAQRRCTPHAWGGEMPYLERGGGTRLV
jgi:hypothetical protein